MYESLIRDIEVMKYHVQRHGCSCTFLINSSESIEKQISFLERYCLLESDEISELRQILKDTIKQLFYNI